LLSSCEHYKWQRIPSQKLIDVLPVAKVKWLVIKGDHRILNEEVVDVFDLWQVLLQSISNYHLSLWLLGALPKFSNESPPGFGINH
jgi:hypothetical protein